MYWLVEEPTMLIVRPYDPAERASEEPAYKYIAAWALTKEEAHKPLGELYEELFGRNKRDILELGVAMWKDIVAMLKSPRHRPVQLQKYHYLEDRPSAMSRFVRAEHACALCAVHNNRCSECTLKSCSEGSYYDDAIGYDINAAEHILAVQEEELEKLCG